MRFQYTPTTDEVAHKQRRREERLRDTSAAFRRPNQVLGQRSTIGCVALEITQRCNLDCTLCYLSEYSEAVPDPPMSELKRKLDYIKDRFGVHTNVQITGGDPTLRPRDELVEIVRYAARIGLYPALFTNGIRASRDMLHQLADVGLVDVAFHVDLTQERKGYQTEISLNEVRDKYLERARGLGLAVIFNTTVFQGNIAEIPDLVRFFVRHAGELGMASFQMQADTGRGYLRKREDEITKQRICRLIEEGCSGVHLSWESVLFGHPECHNIAYCLVAGGQVVDLFDDVEVLSRWLSDFGTVALDRTQVVQSATRVLQHMLVNRPDWLQVGGRWAGRKLMQVLPPLVRQAVETRKKPQLGKLSFFIQNFMDADSLKGEVESERVKHCSFHVATRDGSVSMCEHNARRDDFIIPASLVRGRDIAPKRPPIAAVLRPDGVPAVPTDA